MRDYIVQIAPLAHGFREESEYLAVRREQIIEEDYQRERSILIINKERKEAEQAAKLLGGLEAVVASLENLHP